MTIGIDVGGGSGSSSGTGIGLREISYLDQPAIQQLIKGTGALAARSNAMMNLLQGGPKWGAGLVGPKFFEGGGGGWREYKPGDGSDGGYQYGHQYPTPGGGVMTPIPPPAGGGRMMYRWPDGSLRPTPPPAGGGGGPVAMARAGIPTEYSTTGGTTNAPTAAPGQPDLSGGAYPGRAFDMNTEAGRAAFAAHQQQLASRTQQPTLLDAYARSIGGGAEGWTDAGDGNAAMQEAIRAGVPEATAFQFAKEYLAQMKAGGQSPYAFTSGHSGGVELRDYILQKWKGKGGSPGTGPSSTPTPTPTPTPTGNPAMAKTPIPQEYSTVKDIPLPTSDTGGQPGGSGQPGATTNGASGVPTPGWTPPPGQTNWGDKPLWSPGNPSEAAAWKEQFPNGWSDVADKYGPSLGPTVLNWLSYYFPQGAPDGARFFANYFIMPDGKRYQMVSDEDWKAGKGTLPGGVESETPTGGAGPDPSTEYWGTNIGGNLPDWSTYEEGIGTPTGGYLGLLNDYMTGGGFDPATLVAAKQQQYNTTRERMGETAAQSAWNKNITGDTAGFNALAGELAAGEADVYAKGARDLAIQDYAEKARKREWATGASQAEARALEAALMEQLNTAARLAALQRNQYDINKQWGDTSNFNMGIGLGFGS